MTGYPANSIKYLFPSHRLSKALLFALLDFVCSTSLPFLLIFASAIQLYRSVRAKQVIGSHLTFVSFFLWSNPRQLQLEKRSMAVSKNANISLSWFRYRRSYESIYFLIDEIWKLFKENIDFPFCSCFIPPYAPLIGFYLDWQRMFFKYDLAAVTQVVWFLKVDTIKIFSCFVIEVWKDSLMVAFHIPLDQSCHSTFESWTNLPAIHCLLQRWKVRSAPVV